MSERINDVNTNVPDIFFGGSDIPAMTKVVTLASGAGNLARGTVLGKVTKGAATVAEKSGGNTGNGTLVLDAENPILANAKAGVYALRISRAAAEEVKAIAEFKNHDGKVLEFVELATTPGNVVANQLNFVVLEGDTPFVAGDGFDITVAAGSGHYKPANSTNIDGSNVASCILAAATNATSAAVTAMVYTTGQFNANALTFGGSDDADDHREALKATGITLTDY